MDRARALRLFLALLFLVPVAACDGPVAPSTGPLPGAANPALAGGGGPDRAATSGCVADADFTVATEAELASALDAAEPGDVIALDGTVEVTRRHTFRTRDLTLTCRRPGSGLRLPEDLESFGGQIMLGVYGPGATVRDLVIEGHDLVDGPVLVHNDPEFDRFARDVRFVRNRVTCEGGGGCLRVSGVPDAVIEDNTFRAEGIVDDVVGIQGDFRNEEGVRVDGDMPVRPALRNRIVGNRVTTSVRADPADPVRPHIGLVIRANVESTVRDNVVVGPFRRGLLVNFTRDTEFLRNEVRGTRVHGVSTSGLFGGPPLTRDNVFRANVVRSEAGVGFVANQSCANDFTGNRVGVGGAFDVVFLSATGANRWFGPPVRARDAGGFDCDGDGRDDPNRIRP